MKRVVVTGIGLVTPLGCGVNYVWNALLAGKCGVRKLESPEYDKIPSKVAARVPGFNASEYVTAASEIRTMSPASLFALAASIEAVKDTGIVDFSAIRKRTGVAVGMGMSDLEYIIETANILKNKGPSKISPYFVPRILTNMAAGIISIKHGFHGPNHSVSTACATGAHSIGDATNFIRHGGATAMVCGGTESCISPLSMAGFSRLRALSTKHNDSPEKASRPFDTQRDGFVMGEGAGILFLEELDSALSRKAKIYAEILGYGTSGDASHLTAPSEEGTGAIQAMQNALDDARLSAEQVGYVNAHATSTPLGDAIEVRAINKVFSLSSQKQPWVSSMKGSLGHGQGAAGAIETILAILSIHHSTLPPNINLETPDPSMVDLVRFTPSHPLPWSLESGQNRRILLKNSFGFGGTNASLCIASFSP
ncbi:3-oxoacyl-[acyl-carrier-protein] synthase, mitochondrial-like [Daphnia pulex]|uniref:3-oxoacyl-[acyl-carrier-protein] synthase, mitochondrial-like n=1 Tax=Daphnia pulex TaxID=6669 RepID=UPI001EDD4DF8|nr:3-oxoacyl-[acyl-carrier-protein] synthase, mitochondrial-like [Daphnia pulex]